METWERFFCWVSGIRYQGISVRINNQQEKINAQPSTRAFNVQLSTLLPPNS